jgi:hypothetical protein
VKVLNEKENSCWFFNNQSELDPVENSMGMSMMSWSQFQWKFGQLSNVEHVAVKNVAIG